ncbi:MAG TPA: transposase [Anaerolineales bacterium]|nr:transposase [Anaerolineales bacterium]
MTFPSYHDPAHLYFVTASIIEWKRLFITPEYINIPLQSLSWLEEQKRILLFAFVIMPSHLHLILKPESSTIGEVVQQFGSYTAHEILNRLREQNQRVLLDLFKRRKRDQRHEHSIWQDIQAKNIYSLSVLQQKMEYIHQNPIAKEWKLAKDRADYPYSSAGYYDYGRKPVIEITDINEWLAARPSPGPAKGAERS